MLSGCGGEGGEIFLFVYILYCTCECEGTGLLVVHALNTATMRVEAIVEGTVGCASPGFCC